MVFRQFFRENRRVLKGYFIPGGSTKPYGVRPYVGTGFLSVQPTSFLLVDAVRQLVMGKQLLATADSGNFEWVKRFGRPPPWKIQT